jgi:ADP-heptose:LPS heptosyltransferase
VAVSAPPRAIVLRALKLGDTLTAIPALRALAGLRGHEIVLCAPKWLSPVIDASRTVHAIVDTPQLDPLPLSLHRAAYAINLHGRGPTSTQQLLATEPARLIAFEHDEVPPTAGSPPWHEGEHEVHRWCRLVAESDLPIDVRERARRFARSSDALRLPRPLLRRPERVGCTVLHPGASTGSRRWPVERWAELRGILAARGHRVVVTGDRSEYTLRQDVMGRALSHHEHRLAGESLEDLMEVVAHARLVVVGDTGVAHLATAYRTPSVILYGPESPSRWGPPIDGPHIALWTGRRGDPRADELDPALANIDVDMVVGAIARLCRWTENGWNGMPAAAFEEHRPTNATGSS